MNQFAQHIPICNYSVLIKVATETDNNDYVTSLLIGSKMRSQKLFKSNESKPVGSCWDFSSYGHVQVWSPGHERAQAVVNPKFPSLRIVKYNCSNNFLATGSNFPRVLHTKCQTLCGLPSEISTFRLCNGRLFGCRKQTPDSLTFSNVVCDWWIRVADRRCS